MPEWFNQASNRAVCLKCSPFCAGTARPFPPPNTVSSKLGTSAQQPCKDPKNALSPEKQNANSHPNSSSQTFWSFAKTISRNFHPSTFPPICNSSGKLNCEAQEKRRFCSPVRLQFHFAPFFHIFDFFLSPSVPLFFLNLMLALGRLAKHCALSAFPNHSTHRP